MAGEKIAQLSDRGIVSVAGSDARKLLQSLITNDMGKLAAHGDALYGALLTPQGKILFDFFVVQIADGFLLDTAAASVPGLAKRLAMYRLRADAAIANASSAYRVFVHWGAQPPDSAPGTLCFEDPRDARLGHRLIVDAAKSDEFGSLSGAEVASPDAYAAHRIALGVPESSADFELSDAYPHEADLDVFHGVSFDKGCFVGQEVVARMNNKAVVRKRVVKIKGSAPLSCGADVSMGDVAIGRVGSVDGSRALAMLRLDRAADAFEKAIPLTVGAATVTVDDEAIRRYRASLQIHGRGQTP